MAGVLESAIPLWVMGRCCVLTPRGIQSSDTPPSLPAPGP